MLRRLRERSWTQPTLISLAIAVAVNCAIIIALLCSRGGAETAIVVTVAGQRYSAQHRGEVFAATLDGPASGGVIIEIAETEQLSSLDDHAGIDWVRVVASDGSVLLEDGFSNDTSGWTASSNIVVRDGLAQLADAPNRIGRLTFAAAEARDYRVELRARNIHSLAIFVRAQPDGSAVVYRARPLRQLDQSFAVLGQNEMLRPSTGNDAHADDGPPFALPPEETAKQIAIAGAGAFVRAAVIALALLVLIVIAVLVPLPSSFANAGDRGRAAPWATIASASAAALAVATLATTFTLQWRYLDGVPHIPDAVAYLFQAKIIAGGHVAASPPPVPQSFEFFYPPMMWAEGDRWASVFPLGHSLALVPGTWLHAPWIMPPLIAAANTWLIFVLGRRWFGAITGIVAAALYAASPFALMNAADFMSHNTATFYLLLTLALLFRDGTRQVAFAVGAGVAFGLLFNTRPLTAVAIIPALTLTLALLAWRARGNRQALGAEAMKIAGLAGGAVVMFGAYLLYNLGTTGDALTSGYAASGQAPLGFNDGHSLAQGLANFHMLLAVYVVVLHAWPAWIGLMLAIAPFALGTRDARDWLLALAIVSVMAAYMLFPDPGIAYGPRFWFETVPLAMLLTARGAALLADRLGAAGTRVAGWFKIERERPWAAPLVVYALVAALLVLGVQGWLFSRDARWLSDGTPATARDMRGFNGVNDGLVRLLGDGRLQNALVITEKCPSWQCYGTVFWLNEPDLDGRIVVAQRVDDELRTLLEAYPERRVYSADYEAGVVYPYGTRRPSPSQQGLVDLTQAPLAAEVARTLPP